MGGEAASAESIRNWQSKLKDTVLLVNEYGPTETTVSALYYPISKQIPSDAHMYRLANQLPIQTYIF